MVRESGEAAGIGSTRRGQRFATQALRIMDESMNSPLGQGGAAKPRGLEVQSLGPKVCNANLGISMRSREMAMAPPADLGTRIDRYRCCLPALAGFSI